MRLIKANEKYGPAYYYLGLIYFNSKDAHTAIKYLNLAIKHSPRFKAAYTLMAEVYKSLGQTDEAQRYINAANSF